MIWTRKKNYLLNGDGLYNNFRVSFKDNEVLKFENKKALIHGGEYKIDESRLLTVQLVKKKLTGAENLEILINNEPIKGSATDPFEIIKGVWVLLLALAGLNIVFGLIAELFSIDILLNLGMGIGTIMVGIIYLGFGLWIKTKSSMIALIISILLLAADMIFSIVYMSSSSSTSYLVKLFFIIMLFRGIGAIKRIKKLNIR